MASPTGASDSILVPRRNGASVERCHHAHIGGQFVGRFGGHFAPHFQNYQMESNDNRFKKSWGDKWNVNKTGKNSVDVKALETSNLTVHPDYLNRYGTLSGGVLTKSVKCAETWLYGTMGFRSSSSSQRPSLFLCPGMVFPSPRLANHSNYLSSPTNFPVTPLSSHSSVDHPNRLFSSSSSSSASSSPSPSSPSPHLLHSTSPSRKISNHHRFGNNHNLDSKALCSVPKKINERKSVTSRNALTVDVERNKTFSRESNSTREKKNCSSASDPYNIMRKSRLGVVEGNEISIFGIDHGQSRHRKSANGSLVKVQSFEVVDSTFEKFEPNSENKEIKLWKKSEEEVTRRKSILECDVNVYELNKSRSKDLDDSSDESGGQITNRDSTKVKNSRPKFNKTDDSNASEGKSQAAKLKNLEVRLNGQRFKIFDDSRRPSASVEGFASEREEDATTTTTTTTTTTSSLEPMETLPRRPPRRSKEKILAEPGLKQTTRLRSKSSPNLSIKSILKKKSVAGEDESFWIFLTPFDPENPIPKASPTVREDDFRSSSPGRLANANSNANTLKKKKQVQFRVNNSYESLEVSSESNMATSNKKMEKAKESDEPNEPNEPKEPNKSGESNGIDKVTNDSNVLTIKSKSCENLIFLRQKDGGRSSATGFDENDDERKQNVDNKHFETEDLFSNNGDFGFKRSYSDRRFASGFLLHGNDTVFSTISSLNSTLFNDTMAIRTRNSKPNTAKMVFKTFELNSKGRNSNSKTEKKQVLDELLKKASENVESSSVEANKFLNGSEEKIKDEPSLKISREKSKTTSKSFSAVETHSSSNFPNPPPRRLPTEKLKKDGKKIAVRISGEECKKLKSRRQESNANNLRRNSVKIAVENNSDKNNGFRGDQTTEGKTVVRLGSNETDEKVSVTIQSEEEINKSTKDKPERKTSVIISNFPEKDSNKVTINVRNESSYDQPNSSTCTIIETGSNSTVIPVVSKDNKTTLIVGSNGLAGVAGPGSGNNSTASFFSFEDAENTFSRVEKPARYSFETISPEIEKAIESLDPVEAIRRNLIPHICGKDNESLNKKPETLHETPKRMNSFKKEAEDEILQNSLNNEKVIAEENKCNFGTTTETPRSRSTRSSATDHLNINTFKNNVNNGNLENGFSRDSSSPTAKPASKLYIPFDLENFVEHEKDKTGCECENGGCDLRENEKNCENIYETIREPTYDGSYESLHENEDLDRQNVHLNRRGSPPTNVDEAKTQRSTAKSIFEGASKYDILNYLADAKERVEEDFYLSGENTAESLNYSNFNTSKGFCEKLLAKTPPETAASSDAKKTNDVCDDRRTFTKNDSEADSSSSISRQSSYLNDDNSHIANLHEDLTRKSSAEIERNDSGVGSETSHTFRSRWQVSSSIREDPHHLCEDCDQTIETQVTEGGVTYVPLVCRKCSKKRSERKEIIQEIVETEEKYGRDLKIILEEFYTPMLVAGLLSQDQLSSIFLNTEELLENSEQLTERLRDSLEIAADQGDEDLLTVNVGKLFIEAEPMLHAFESYCTRQGAAAMLLASLEKEKELLRIFLRVSQMENAVLRRMNLNSFLMVPVQRVTKYPLLLARLYKVTPVQQEGRELLKEAQHTIELHLEHMNSEAKDLSATKVWRRFSNSAVGGRKSTTESEMVNIKLRKMAVDVLEWNHEEVRFILEGKLLYTQPTDNNWKRGRTIKLNPIFVLLVTLGKPNSKYKLEPGDEDLTFPAKTGIREATLLMVKEKCGRYTLIREPLYLDKIIVCCETELDEYFEVQELLTKECFIFKAEDGERTKEWYKQLQYHAQILGAWRKRRNALANIMINGMLARTCAT